MLAFPALAGQADSPVSQVPTAPDRAADPRFGLVGTGGAAFAARFGLRYYTLEGNYAPGNGGLFSSVNPGEDPAPGFSVVREVAKLNVRTDALGQTQAEFQAALTRYVRSLAAWHLIAPDSRGPKPGFTWYRPDADALVQAESLHIVRTIRREKARNPAVTGTVWEIGNEPNLFPALTPAEYAAIFANYHKVIKAEDPTAQVAMGSLFLPEPSADLKARMSGELEARMRTELEAAGHYAALNESGLFATLVGDVTATLLSRILALPAREYLSQVLDATEARPDIVTLHVYPFDDRPPFLDSVSLRATLDATLAGIGSMLAAAGAPAPLWITEFGNIEQGLDEAGVADRSRRLIEAFRADSAVAMWFHYKSTGSDEQFALIATGPAPLTRLAADGAFAPLVGDFPCAALNAVGRMYWEESHAGETCREPDPASLGAPSGSRFSHPGPWRKGHGWNGADRDLLGRSPITRFRPR